MAQVLFKDPTNGRIITRDGTTPDFSQAVRFRSTVTFDGAATLSGGIAAGATITTPVMSGSPTGAGVVQYVDVSLTNAEMLALRATPKTLVAAPAAGSVNEFISISLFFDYTGAYTESADNMAVRYTNGSGVVVSSTIEATGFVDATADTMVRGVAITDAIVAKTGCDAQALVLHNTGDGEYGGGNAANVVRARVAYRVVPAGW